jgi:AcrR family transcriptional regulator
MPRKQHEIESRRRFILEAAGRLCREEGVDEPSMDELASAAEYTRQTLYKYFHSRDEILLRVFCHELRLRWSRQQAGLAEVTGCVVSLRAWARGLFDYWEENPHCMRMEMFWDYHGIDAESVGEEALAEFAELNSELAEHLRAIFHAGVGEGSLRRDLDIDMCMSQFVQSVRTTAHRALSDSYSFADFEPESYLRQFLDIFFTGICSRPGPETKGRA